ncbi:hypothetical protein J43TS9_37480 [Paenibacillus cineris]|nr:hypothetical protein J43TS9_37480 [Paenibacillus cineris]
MPAIGCNSAIYVGFMSYDDIWAVAIMTVPKEKLGIPRGGTTVYEPSKKNLAAAHYAAAGAGVSGHFQLCADGGDRHGLSKF